MITAALLWWGAGRRATPARAWRLLAVGQALGAAAWAYWFFAPPILGPLGSPNVGDAFFLSTYAVSAVVVCLLAAAAGADRRSAVDGAILVAGLSIAVLAGPLGDLTTAGDVTLGARLVSLAYPVLDVVLLAAALQLAFTGRPTGRSVLLCVWAALQLVGDAIYQLQVLEGSFRLGAPVFAWWLLALGFLAAAAVSRDPSATPSVAPGSRLHRVRNAVVVLSVLPLPAMLLVRAVQQSSDDLWLIAGGSVLVALLTVVRMEAAVKEGPGAQAVRAAVRRSVVRLAAAFLIFALTPLAALTWIAVQESREAVEREVTTRIITGAEASAAFVADDLSSLQDLVLSYADRRLLGAAMGGPDGPNVERIGRHLASLTDRDESYLASWVLDTEGVLRDVYPYDASVVGKSFAHRDYFRNGIRAEGAYVSPAFVTALQGNPRAVAVVAPMRHQDRVVGLLVLGYRLDAIRDFSAKIADVQGVDLKVADRNGVVLAGTDSELPGLPLANDLHVTAALRGESGASRDDRDGLDTFSAFRPIGEYGWAVVAEVPSAEAFAGADRLTSRVVAVAVLLGQALLAGLLLAVRVERRRRAAETVAVRREEQVVGILHASGDAFFSLDGAAKLVRWNAQAEALFGWPAEEALGRDVASLLPGAGGAALAAELASPSGRPVELTVQRRDGSVFPAEVRAWATSADGEMHANAFVRDVTERQLYEAELAEARDAALAASRLKSEFVANMSHEIRTPMNGVIGMTSLLLETDLDRRQRDYLETVRNSGDALLNVINDILDFSKIEVGKLDIEEADFELRPAVEDVVALMAATAQAKGLEIVAIVDADAPAWVRGDGHRLRQVLTNLVSNAVKFTERGEVVVEVECTNSNANSGGGAPLKFSVRDTGPGIPAERQAALFEAFTQLDASTTRRHGGTGLGLTISRQLVTLMGGQLGVSSAVGRGSTFFFTLTLEPVEGPAPASAPTDMEGVRVLVVDDNTTNRRVLEHLCRSWGMRVDALAGGTAAVLALRGAQADGDPYAVALLDMNMPGMTGLDMARAVASHGSSTTRLALLTWGSGMGEAKAAREAGISAYLTKPVREAHLRRTIEELLGGSETAVAAVPADDTPALPQQRAAEARPRLLVAEDNEVNQQVLLGMLERLGYDADVVGTGREVLTAVRERTYGAILMDCQMPELDGYETTRVLRAFPAPMHRIPVIAVTASALATDEQRCRYAGMDHFLPKPLRPEPLRLLLGQVLSGAPASAVPGPDGGEATGGSRDVLDPEQLEALAEMGPDFLQARVPVFLGNAQAAVAVIRAAVDAADLVVVRRTAHSLAGSSGTFAAHVLSRACLDLEEAALTGDAASVKRIAATLPRHVEEMCSALREVVAAAV